MFEHQLRKNNPLTWIETNSFKIERNPKWKIYILH